MTTLQDLLARVESATGADRELDAAIQAALRVQSPSGYAPWVERWSGDWQAHGDRVFLMHADGSRGPNFESMPYTASIDAALALVERVMTEHGPISLTIAGSAVCMIDANDACAPALGESFGKTPALAILSALLKALIAQEAP